MTRVVRYVCQLLRSLTRDYRYDRSSVSRRKRSYPNNAFVACGSSFESNFEAVREETRSYRQTVFLISFVYDRHDDDDDELAKRSRDSRRTVNNRAEGGSPSNEFKRSERNAFYPRHEARNNSSYFSVADNLRNRVEQFGSDQTRSSRISPDYAIVESIAIQSAEDIASTIDTFRRWFARQSA